MLRVVLPVSLGICCSDFLFLYEIPWLVTFLSLNIQTEPLLYKFLRRDLFEGSSSLNSLVSSQPITIHDAHRYLGRFFQVIKDRVFKAFCSQISNFQIAYRPEILYILNPLPLVSSCTISCYCRIYLRNYVQKSMKKTIFMSFCCMITRFPLT